MSTVCLCFFHLTVDWKMVSFWYIHLIVFEKAAFCPLCGCLGSLLSCPYLGTKVAFRLSCAEGARLFAHEQDCLWGRFIRHLKFTQFEGRAARVAVEWHRDVWPSYFFGLLSAEVDLFLFVKGKQLLNWVLLRALERNCFALLLPPVTDPSAKGDPLWAREMPVTQGRGQHCSEGRPLGTGARPPPTHGGRARPAQGRRSSLPRLLGPGGPG